ncbi:unnamed protein product [Sympodiomycopsis kandeliae]
MQRCALSLAHLLLFILLAGWAPAATSYPVNLEGARRGALGTSPLNSHENLERGLLKAAFTVVKNGIMGAAKPKTVVSALASPKVKVKPSAPPLPHSSSTSSSHSGYLTANSSFSSSTSGGHSPSRTPSLQHSSSVGSNSPAPSTAPHNPTHSASSVNKPGGPSSAESKTGRPGDKPAESHSSFLGHTHIAAPETDEEEEAKKKAEAAKNPGKPHAVAKEGPNSQPHRHAVASSVIAHPLPSLLQGSIPPDVETQDSLLPTSESSPGDDSPTPTVIPETPALLDEGSDWSRGPYLVPS